MDLSKRAKKKRDAVEAPLFRVAELRDQLDEFRIRTDATMKVYPETDRTLRPALTKLEQVLSELDELKAELAQLWQEGSEVKWKIDK